MRSMRMNRLRAAILATFFEGVSAQPSATKTRRVKLDYIRSAVCSLRNQYRSGAALRLRFLIRRRQIVRGIAIVEHDVRHLPRLHDRLREDGTRVRRGSFLVQVIATHTDDEEERQLHIVQHIS